MGKDSDCTKLMFVVNRSAGLRGGVQAFQFRKHYFDIWVRGGSPDMYQQLKGGFGSMRAIRPI